MPEFLKQKWFAGIAVALGVVALLVGGIFVVRETRGDKAEEAAPAPVQTPFETAAPTPAPVSTPAMPAPTPVQTPSATPAPKTCTTSDGGFVASSMKIESYNMTSHVLSLGQDSSGAAAAPPKNDKNGTGWYNRGPKPGSDKGNVVLTIHTWHQGGALGNRLLNNTPSVGSKFVMSDSKGNQACYSYTGKKKIAVSDYDPDSDILYNDHGKPQIAIIVCDDYAGPDDWRSRVIFYAEKV